MARLARVVVPGIPHHVTQPVGWVERSETHPNAISATTMGLALLDPSYVLDPSYELL